MNRTPRVLFLDNDPDTFRSHRLDLARAVRAEGFEVHVACPPGRSAARIEAEGFVMHPVQLSRSGVTPWGELATVLRLIRLYRRVKPDLAHHLRLKPVLYGSLAARLTGTPAVVNLITGLGYVFVEDTLKTRLLRKAVKWAGRFAFRGRNQRIVFQNPDDRRLFIQRGFVRAEDTDVILGSGVDVEVFRPAPEPPGPPLVALPARMIRAKGLPEFVEAARLLKRDGVDARFVLVGGADPHNPSAIPEERLEAWSASGVVEWWGHRADMVETLKQTHIACLPSHTEGLPKALLEAAASARPIVATDIPGSREVVRNGENGFLTPVNDAPALAAALRKLIEDPALRERMGARGREIAVREFSLRQVIAATLEIYRELMDARAVQPAASYRFWKRALDVAASSAALIALAPLMLAIAAAVRLFSPGPALYRGVRVGLNGRDFHILKFRTMVTGAERLGGSATANDDPRITPVGRWLRRTKLDELPQFLNVLRGEMSLVGPRPEVRKYVDMYSGEERGILTVKPGVTDWASIWDSDEGAVLESSPDPERAYEELIRPTKLALQLMYVRQPSLTTDLKILFHTAARLIDPKWSPKEIAAYGGQPGSYRAARMAAPSRTAALNEEGL